MNIIAEDATTIMIATWESDALTWQLLLFTELRNSIGMVATMLL